jgi:hypothetical protein
MSEGTTSRQRRARKDVSAVRSAQPTAPAGEEIVGRVVEPMQAGEDVRKRGWFWHWNTIVTQFAPLIGLKGVGLLNSYTVWTDRRDESAYRGYAFPSQQSEASFYGEDRAELIAINKILVALDLIEIRKEMVTRADEQGRRWRVPHNLYRVKDHGDHYNLTTRDVVKVIALAEKDKAVYRTIRHIFSDRFAPIDHQNVWWSIIEELRSHEGWQRLAAKAGAEEHRASARTKAGHAARKQAFYLAGDGDTPTPNDSDSDSPTVGANKGSRTSVATTNNGSNLDVDVSNTGSGTNVAAINTASNSKTGSTVEPSNEGRASVVGGTNTIKDQYVLTTTTTNEDREQRSENREEAGGIPRTIGDVTDERQGDETRVGLAQGPGMHPAPVDAPAESAAIRAFEDANNRISTAAEQRLLRDVATRVELDAWRQRGERVSGWEWVTAAIYEAVESGSTYVAPRRVREIIARWQRDGRPNVDSLPARHAETGTPAEIRLGESADIPLPHGFGSRQTWRFAVARMAATIERGAAESLFAGTAIVAYRDGEVTIAAGNERQVDQLSGPYRAMVERALGEAMRRPVRLAILSPAPEQPAAESTGRHSASADSTIVESTMEALNAFTVPNSGMTNERVWQAVLDDLEASGEVPAANLGAWIRPARLIAAPSLDLLVIGAPHAPAQRRIAKQFTRPIERALSRVLGRETKIEVVVKSSWRGRFGVGASEENVATG